MTIDIRSIRTGVHVVLLFGALGAPSAGAQTEGAYTTIVEIPVLSGGYSFPRAINSSGQVVGSSYLATDEWAAFLYNPGAAELVELGVLTPSHSSSVAFDINDAGHVVGRSDGRAFLWIEGAADGVPSNPQMRALGTLRKNSWYSFGYGINSADQVVGEADAEKNWFQRAFLWEDGAMVELARLGTKDSWSFAHKINDAGQITGASEPQRGGLHVALWQGGRVHDLGIPGVGQDINERGQVVGDHYPTGDGPYQAFVWTPHTDNGTSGSAVNINPPGATYSRAWGINRSGVVVGYSDPFAFIWDAENGTRDLNDLLPDGGGWRLREAFDINDAGQIVGVGFHDGVAKGFVLSP